MALLSALSGSARSERASSLLRARGKAVSERSEETSVGAGFFRKPSPVEGFLASLGMTVDDAWRALQYAESCDNGTARE